MSTATLKNRLSKLEAAAGTTGRLGFMHPDAAGGWTWQASEPANRHSPERHFTNDAEARQWLRATGNQGLFMDGSIDESTD
jgi:hypothetical protein